MNFSAVSDKSLAGRILRFPLRLVPAGAVVPILQGKLKGRKWITGSSNHGCWLGSYEFDKQKIFEANIAAGSVVFDIGANVGFYTLLASVLVGPQGKVFAFEPVTANVQYLKSHLQLNRIANVTVIEAAAWDSSGESGFEAGPNGSTGHVSEAGALRVNTVAIDTLVSGGELPPPTHLKLDVEGAELRVLLGSKSTLTAHHPMIFLATHAQDLHRDCCEFLCSLGYSLQPIGAASLDTADEVLAYAHT